MRNSIEYGRDIIVGVILKGEFNWYVSEKELWILDYPKWGAVFRSSGVDVPDGAEDRFGIQVVDGDTVFRFLEMIRSDKIGTSELRELMLDCDRSDPESYIHLLPSLLVNFDEKILMSFYSEPLEFEQYIPSGWTGKYENFRCKIPREIQYWSNDFK